MEPGPTASNDPHDLKLQQRNAFYESLPPAAKAAFLDELKRAEARGLDAERAWAEAVLSAETTYRDIL